MIIALIKVCGYLIVFTLSHPHLCSSFPVNLMLIFPTDRCHLHFMCVFTLSATSSKVNDLSVFFCLINPQITHTHLTIIIYKFDMKMKNFEWEFANFIVCSSIFSLFSLKYRFEKFILSFIYVRPVCVHLFISFSIWPPPCWSFSPTHIWVSFLFISLDEKPLFVFVFHAKCVNYGCSSPFVCLSWLNFLLPSFIDLQLLPKLCSILFNVRLVPHTHTHTHFLSWLVRLFVYITVRFCSRPSSSSSFVLLIDNSLPSYIHHTVVSPFISFCVCKLFSFKPPQVVFTAHLHKSWP